jgi:hypothetical protein
MLNSGLNQKRCIPLNKLDERRGTGDTSAAKKSKALSMESQDETANVLRLEVLSAKGVHFIQASVFVLKRYLNC